jgi:hypothetical protein
MYQLGCVLVVGVQHYYNIGTQLQGFTIAAFLVAAIAFIHLVLHDVFYTQAFAFSYCVVAAVIIYQHYVIHNIKWYLLICPFQCEGRIVCGQYNNYFLTVEHNYWAKVILIPKIRDKFGKIDNYFLVIFQLLLCYSLLTGIWRGLKARLNSQIDIGAGVLLLLRSLIQINHLAGRFIPVLVV